MLGISRKTSRFVWFFGLLAIFFVCQAAEAQSGRKNSKKTAPTTEQSAPRELNALPPTEEVRKEKIRPGVRFLKVVGEVQQNFGYYKSNEIDLAQKEFISHLKMIAKFPPALTRGGKMNYTQAKEQAKQETEVFVLWLGFLLKADAYGNTYVDSVQYSVLTPQTAEVVTRGQIDLAKSNDGATIKRRGGDVSTLLQMKHAAREVAAVLLRGGWLI